MPTRAWYQGPWTRNKGADGKPLKKIGGTVSSAPDIPMPDETNAYCFVRVGFVTSVP